MAKSECRCANFSCESITIKQGDGYGIDQTRRFRFVKEEGAITDRINLNGIDYFSGPTPNDILNCEIKCRVKYEDRQGVHDNRKKSKRK